MTFTTLILLTLLSQAPTQSTPAVTVQAGGHMYQLFCSREGEEISASETGLCEKTESGGVQHFEIRDEDGKPQFAEDAPGRQSIHLRGYLFVCPWGQGTFVCRYFA